jgi:hypothetical protein
MARDIGGTWGQIFLAPTASKAKSTQSLCTDLQKGFFGSFRIEGLSLSCANDVLNRAAFDSGSCNFVLRDAYGLRDVKGVAVKVFCYPFRPK